MEGMYLLPERLGLAIVEALKRARHPELSHAEVTQLIAALGSLQRHEPDQEEGTPSTSE